MNRLGELIETSAAICDDVADFATGAHHRFGELARLLRAFAADKPPAASVVPSRIERTRAGVEAARHGIRLEKDGR
jgi:hypothetical protein